MTTIKETETAGEFADLKIVYGIRKDDVPILTGADGDYCPLTLNEFGILRTQAQQHKHIEECEATTGWTVLGNDAINLATTVNHVFGQYALEFDKVNGAANTKLGGIQKTITSLNLTPYHVGSGYLLMSIYLPSLADVDYIFLRLGTDSSNYNEWIVDADVLTEGWNLCACIAAHPETVQGNGWIDTAITYIACGVAFDAETDALADIAIDRIAYNTGLVTTTPVIEPKNINLLKIKNKVVNVGAGAPDTGTQRVITTFTGTTYENAHTMANDSAYRFEASATRLRDLNIVVEDEDAVLGDSSNQRYPVKVGEHKGFSSMDISTLYFKNAGAGNNTTIKILGVNE